MIAARFHFIDADLAARRQHVLQTNAEQGDTHTFDLTPPMFEAMEALFERPGGDEGARSQRVLETR